MPLTVSVYHVVGPDLRERINGIAHAVLAPLAQQEEWSVVVFRRQTGCGWNIALRAPDARWFGDLDVLDESAVRATIESGLRRILSSREEVA